jgi:hypothetical protein
MPNYYDQDLFRCCDATMVKFASTRHGADSKRSGLTVEDVLCGGLSCSALCLSSWAPRVTALMEGAKDGAASLIKAPIWRSRCHSVQKWPNGIKIYRCGPADSDRWFTSRS